MYLGITNVPFGKGQGEAPKKFVSVICLLLNQSNFKVFLLIKHTTLIT